MWNEAIIVGNLGRDPEVRRTQSGNMVTTLSVATSDRWKDKDSGEQKERTEWHRVVLFGKLAEIAGDYGQKGATVAVRGAIRTRKWTDQSGQDRYSTEIVVEGFEGKLKILKGGKDGGGSSSSGNGNGSRGHAPADDDLDDDIPF